MRNELDHFVKSTLSELDEVPDVSFGEERVWGKIEPKLPRTKGGPLFYLLLINDWILLGLFLFLLFPNSLETPPDKSKEKVKEYHQKTITDFPITFETNDLEINNSSVTKIKSNKGVQRHVAKTKDFPIQPVVITKPLQLLEYTMLDKIMVTAEFDKKPLQRTMVHIYRPRRYVGSALVFRLKANGVPIERIKSGMHTVHRLKSGHTQFVVGKQTLNVNLKPDKTYYLRIRYDGFPIGRPTLDWIAREYAIKELAQLDEAVK
ncbi:MAG: hypothetical protein AAGJ12_11110 [Bacteroidota bacterium]